MSSTSAAAASSTSAASDPPDENAAAVALRAGLDLAQTRFEYAAAAASAAAAAPGSAESASAAATAAALQATILAAVVAGDMAPLYERLCLEHGWPRDAALAERAAAANAAALARLDAAVADAREKFGDVEVYDRQMEKARYCATIGDMPAAMAVFAAMTAAGAHVST